MPHLSAVSRHRTLTPPVNVLLLPCQDYKRRDELRGNDVITRDPGRTETVNAGSSTSGNSGAARGGNSRNTVATEGSGLMAARGSGGRVAAGEDGRPYSGEGSHLGCEEKGAENMGRLPLDRRPQLHRNYYKVNKTCGGVEECVCVLCRVLIVFVFVFLYI